MSHSAEPLPMSARRSGPLKGEAQVPGDKSVSHRALILGALAVGETRITGLLEGQDVLDTAKAMQAFGAQVQRVGEGEWIVHGVGVGGFAADASSSALRRGLRRARQAPSPPSSRRRLRRSDGRRQSRAVRGSGPRRGAPSGARSS